MRLLRVPNLAVSFVGTLVGALVARGSGVSAPAEFWAIAVLAAISTACVTAGRNELNDLLDRDIDRVNHPDRPLVTGEIRVEFAEGLVVALFVTGLFVALPVIALEPLVGLIFTVAVLALFGYEFWFKAQGFAGNLVVAFLTGMVFLYGGAAVGDASVLVPFAGMAFFATLSREVIKDMEDVRGDIGRTTLPMAYGLAASGRFARLFVLAGILLSAVPLAWFVSVVSAVGIIYVALVGAADAVFAVSVLYLPDRLHYEQTLSKVAMTVALFAFLAVAFR